MSELCRQMRRNERYEACDAEGGLFLLHLSSDRSGRALPVILALWSPDFPHALPFEMCPRSFGLLANAILTLKNEKVNKNIVFTHVGGYNMLVVRGDNYDTE